MASSTNLSAKQLTTWKGRVDRAISRDLLSSLKKSYEDVVQIAKITSTQDGSELSTRFKDLSKVIDKSYQQLTKFMRSFDSSLTEYISTMEKAEQTASAKTKATTDKFSEAASMLSKLKM